MLNVCDPKTMFVSLSSRVSLSTVIEFALWTVFTIIICTLVMINSSLLLYTFLAHWNLPLIHNRFIVQSVHWHAGTLYWYIVL